MNLIASNILTMTSQQISDLVGSRHDNVRTTIVRLADRGVIQLPAMKEVRNHLGQRVSVYQVGKRDSFVIVAQLSPEFTAALVDRWQELEEGAAPKKSGIDAGSKIIGELAILECFDRLLKPAPSSKLMMLSKIAENNGLDPKFLPSYAVDAASGESSMQTKPLTVLLREHKFPESAGKFNWRLHAAGFISRSSRVNSKRETVYFWTINEKGMAYGKNITSPAQPRETQPHWYAETFGDLLSIVSGN